MPEEVEIETKELQETIEEMHEERREREESEKKNAWTRWIALSTALLAVFAAVSALQSGALVNGAMMDQLKASDTWNEYQAARQKEHLYTVEANTLLDRGAKAGEGGGGGAGNAHGAKPSGSRSAVAHGGHGGAPAGGEHGAKPAAKKKEWKTLTPDLRLAQYLAKVKSESDKQDDLKAKAEHLQHAAEHQEHAHHNFAYAVTLIQVAIALSAIAALTRIKSAWAMSLVAGAIGLFFFVRGFM